VRLRPWQMRALQRDRLCRWSNLITHSRTNPAIARCLLLDLLSAFAALLCTVRVAKMMRKMQRVGGVTRGQLEVSQFFNE
jgi:hypothetical protein